MISKPKWRLSLGTYCDRYGHEWMNAEDSSFSQFYWNSYRVFLAFTFLGNAFDYWPFITDRVRSTRGGNVFTLFTICGEGGTPSSWWGGTPFPCLDGGYPIQLTGGATPFPGLDGGGTPSSWWGVLPSQVWRGVPPSQVWTGGCPLPRSRWGYPLAIYPQQGYPPYRSNIACTCYTAVGMPLAFAQEDFLVDTLTNAYFSATKSLTVNVHQFAAIKRDSKSVFICGVQTYFFTAHIPKVWGRYYFHRCLSVHTRGEGTPSPSHNTSIHWSHVLSRGYPVPCWDSSLRWDKAAEWVLATRRAVCLFAFTLQDFLVKIGSDNHWKP